MVSDTELSPVNASLNAGYQVAAAAAGAAGALLYNLVPSFWLNAALAAIGFLGAATAFFVTQMLGGRQLP